MASTFPTGVILDPSRSRLRQDFGNVGDRTARGYPRSRLISRPSVEFTCVYHGMSLAKKNEVYTFLSTTRATDITIIWRGLSATGRVLGNWEESYEDSDSYVIRFLLKCYTENVESGLWALNTGVWDDSEFWQDSQNWID
jgi:hypothetical protein